MSSESFVHLYRFDQILPESLDTQKFMRIVKMSKNVRNNLRNSFNKKQIRARPIHVALGGRGSKMPKFVITSCMNGP